jgi:hypothetical protein
MEVYSFLDAYRFEIIGASAFGLFIVFSRIFLALELHPGRSKAKIQHPETYRSLRSFYVATNLRHSMPSIVFLSVLIIFILLLEPAVSFFSNNPLITGLFLFVAGYLSRELILRNDNRYIRMPVEASEKLKSITFSNYSKAVDEKALDKLPLKPVSYFFPTTNPMSQLISHHIISSMSTSEFYLLPTKSVEKEVVSKPDTTIE